MKTTPTMATIRPATKRQNTTIALRLLSLLESRGERTNHAFINASNTICMVILNTLLYGSEWSMYCSCVWVGQVILSTLLYGSEWSMYCSCVWGGQVILNTLLYGLEWSMYCSCVWVGQSSLPQLEIKQSCMRECETKTF